MQARNDVHGLLNSKLTRLVLLVVVAMLATA
jgi:hypothetical protein